MTRRLRCGVTLSQGAAVGSIIGVSVAWLLTQEFWDPLKKTADERVTNASAQQAVDWTGIAFENFLVITLAITVLGVIVAASYQRQGRL